MAYRSASDCQALSSQEKTGISQTQAIQIAGYRRLRSPVVVTTVGLFYDAAIAVALVAVAALVCGLVVTGGSSPNLPATIAFVLTGGFMFFRLRRILRESTQ